MFIDTIQIGDASSNAAQYIKKAGANVVLDIGESAAPIDNMYVSNITLANGGGISGLSVESFGTSGAPIDQAFISNVASGTFHLTSAGLYGNIVNSGGSTVLNPADGVVAQETTAQTLTNKTLILIAHKLSSIKNVDKVIFLENGTIKEFGDFNELIQRKGLFYNHFFEQRDMHETTIHH